MPKKATIAAYTIVFWGIIPVLILAGSNRLDRWLEWDRSPFPIAGSIVLLLSVPLLSLSLAQYIKYSGELPVSAFPPKNILRRGVYNYWRHPIYLFYIGTLLGVALILGSIAMLLVVMPVFTIFTWLYLLEEEKQLTKRFGKAYIYYKKRTGLLIPEFYQRIRYPSLLLMKWLYHYQVCHKDRIPLSPPYFVVAEHKNYSDPLLIGLAFSHPISFMTTYEMYRSPFMIRLMERMFNIPRKRFKPDFASNKRMLEALDMGAVIGIFPEGERSWTGETQSFKPEVLKLLLKKNEIPVVPVKIEGNYAAWPRWAKGFRRYEVSVEIKEPIHGHRDFSTEELENCIRERLGESQKTSKIASKIVGLSDGLEKVLYRCSACQSFNSLAPEESGLVCRNCGFSLRVADDLSIRFEKDGRIQQQTLPESYHSIRVTADDTIFRERGQDTADSAFWVDLQESGHCILSMERGIVLEPVQKGQLRLTADSMVCQDQDRTLSIPFADIRSVTTESNDKLQIYLKTDVLYQLQFEKGSVLQWQDILTSAILLNTGRTVNKR